MYTVAIFDALPVGDGAAFSDDPAELRSRKPFVFAVFEFKKLFCKGAYEVAVSMINGVVIEFVGIGDEVFEEVLE